MTKALDLTGQRFGRLLVESSGDSTSSGRKWNCVCVCGTRLALTTRKLTGGQQHSCGCLKRELLAARNTKHGMTNTPTWRSWQGMKSRCLNPNSTSYERYGGRGIKIYAPWLDFKNFLKDMGERPEGTSLDRLNPNGDYGPTNCRWATSTEQRRNQRPRIKRDQMTCMPECGCVCHA